MGRDWPGVGKVITRYSLTHANKECGYCRKFKALKHFNRRNDCKNGYTTYCTDCLKITNRLNSKIRYHKNKRRFADKNRQCRLKAEYGITAAQYDEMLEKQNFKCAVCLKSTDEFPERLAIDHCHKTNKIRGLLCSGCNFGLGNFKDSIFLLEQAIKYLGRDNELLKTVTGKL